LLRPGVSVNSDEFESKVLELWMKSRVPLTQANLQYFAGVPRRELNQWIDKLLGAGVLDIEDDGSDDEIEYSVPGAQRSLDGPATCEEYERKRKLVDEAKERILARRAGKPMPEPSSEPTDYAGDSESSDDEDEEDEEDDGPGVAGIVGKAALMASGKALVALDKPLALLDKPRGKGEKSLPLSAGLSLLGPIGWLYAGSFREAIPATAAAVAAYYILPSFIVAPFLLVGALASGAVGLTYAWQFNRKKGRTPLFLSDKSKKKSKKNEE
jgi:hypothetical protein